MGLPWYRPTTLLRLTSGADYGWRSGTDRWPEDYPDTLQPSCDVGPGSPTGVRFVRWTLCLLDWTFGTVYQRSNGRVTPFLTGQPLPLTAIVDRANGMYLLTGGRGLPSVLYWVAFGPPSEPRFPPARDPFEPDVQGQLESFHGHADPAAVDTAWPHLGDADPYVRNAARIAVEWQPVAQWRQRALAETDAPRALQALLALARQGDANDLEPVLVALARLADQGLKDVPLLDWVRVHQLACIRLGKPTGELRERTIVRLFARWPDGTTPRDDRARQELTALLCALDAPGIVDKALPCMLNAPPEPIPAWAEVTKRNATYGGVIQKMLADMPPVTAITYATALRTVAHGWTLEQREQFFRFLAAARKKPGGASYGGYLARIWKDAMATCTPAERSALAATVGEKIPEPPPFRATPPKGPGREWQLDDAAALARAGLLHRDYARGHNLYFAASCAACHRFAGEGGNVGPDLTSLGNKFGARDVLESILLPSKVISDQYGGTVLTKKDGSTVFGRLQRVSGDGGDVWVGTAATADATAIRVPAADVVKAEPSKISPMPASLANSLNPDELLDLLAFLLSRGDERAPAFAK
jgi:putative heme-binding domain-containing protein